MNITGSTNHLLDFDEQRWVKEHPFDITAVRVRRQCELVVALEDQLDAARNTLDTLVAEMDERMRNGRG